MLPSLTVFGLNPVNFVLKIRRRMDKMMQNTQTR